MEIKGTNILNSILDALNVKHTERFSNKYFNENPHKYNLFGISKMLSDYRVKNAGARIEDKFNNILNIQCPFIAHMGGDFAVVYNVTDIHVEYRTGDLNFIVKREKFCNNWSGVILLVESDSNSIEPDYKINLKNEFFKTSLKFLLLLAIVILVTIIFTNSHNDYSHGLVLSFFINLIGAYIAYLIVQKQAKIHSSYSDKICSLLKQANCNDILDSTAAKLWGIIG